MITKLKLERFKNFKSAELFIGPLTTLIGSNASGKSNIRDAFRFLHGIGRGYTLAEIMGEKYGEGGVLQWGGIRGGTREAIYHQNNSFKITVQFDFKEKSDAILLPELLDLVPVFKATYTIEIEIREDNQTPKVVQEVLRLKELTKNNVFEEDGYPVFSTLPTQSNAQLIDVLISGTDKEDNYIKPFFNGRPILTQILEKISYRKGERGYQNIEETISMLASMRFLDLHPQAMRRPSYPGQTTLGDQGENLSSVLQAIYEDPQQRNGLIEWIRELTPMDAAGFEFIPDQTGKILLNLMEENGQRTSAYSASDGTLRFLAMIAALLGPNPEKLYFFEELDNGLHPARLYLLLQLIEQKVFEGNIHIIATTHSPQLLRFLSAKARQYASLVYRLPDTPAAHIKPIMDIPDAQRIIAQQDLAQLHESGWFEDAMFFDEAAVTE